MALSDTIQRLMKEQGLNQKELAEKVGITPASVSFILSGDRPDPQWSTIQALAKALGVSVEAFLPDESKPSAEPVKKEKTPPKKRKGAE